MIGAIQRIKQVILSLSNWKLGITFSIGAICVGIACVIFAEAAELANHLFLSFAKKYPYLPLVITPLSMTAIVWLTIKFFPGAQGSGIPQAIAALNTKTKVGLLSIRIAVGKIILTVLGLLAGGSIGREGPSVHVGSSIMYSLSRFIKFPRHYFEKALILAGGAAGIAAAFNTPLAGIVFAIEEMNRGFEKRITTIIIIAVIIAGGTASLILGPYHYFENANSNASNDLSIWIAAIVCGAIGGILGGAFANILISGSQRIAPIARKTPLRIAFIAGLCLAIVAFLSDYSASGTGYLEAKNIIENNYYDPWYPLNKFLATIATYLTGIPGGIFAPSLATGAGIGANLAEWFNIAPFSVMVLLGMASYFSGVVQSPLTAFIIVIEMTTETDIILPLLAATFIAYIFSKIICPKPLYHTLAQAFIGKENST
tara:strand:+ start:7016 stop:8299 length:1284 start_codon:yes stop_codon:yes gene_type:complete